MAEIAPLTAITSVPMPTTLALVPAASSPIGFPAPPVDADFQLPTTVAATGTSTGTTALTISGATKPIGLGSTITGTGVPANTRIVGQTSGPPGGNGIYVTNNVTTMSAVALTLTLPTPIDPAGNTPPIVVNPATVIPGEPLTKTNAGHDYVLALPTFAWMPLKYDATNIFNLSTHPPFGTTGFPWNPPPPPALTMTRTPPFPGYP